MPKIDQNEAPLNCYAIEADENNGCLSCYLYKDLGADDCECANTSNISCFRWKRRDECEVAFIRKESLDANL